MATGDSTDILSRVKRLIPNRWFSFVAPFRDAVMGGLSDLASWNYSWIIYARLQSRLATATGLWLDIWCLDFLGSFIKRGTATDSVFRALIQATILKERVTRHGMFQAVKTLTGNDPVIFEPWNAGDAGAYSNTSTGKVYGQFGYGVGKGGYGSYQFPGQVFMKAVRGANSGVPNVGGYGGYAGGYKGADVVNGQTGPVGKDEYVGLSTRLIGVTDQMIENLIVFTKPTGTIVWLQIT